MIRTVSRCTSWMHVGHPQFSCSEVCAWVLGGGGGTKGSWGERGMEGAIGGWGERGREHRGGRGGREGGGENQFSNKMHLCWSCVLPLTCQKYFIGAFTFIYGLILNCFCIIMVSFKIWEVFINIMEYSVFQNGQYVWRKWGDGK